MIRLRSELLKFSLALCVLANINQLARASDFKSNNFSFDNRPSLGQVLNLNNQQTDILLGGFSGLYFEGFNGDNLRFVTHPDRGPNSEPTDLITSTAGKERPFPLPDFQPEIVRFDLNPQTSELQIINRIGLTNPNGTTPLTGLPNLQAGMQGTAYTDEVPVDLSGNLLSNDPLGADLEGVVIDNRDNSFWMVDEYRPAIYHFDATGTMLDRFIPLGTAAAAGESEGTFGTEILPSVYAQRRRNRGFEAVALNKDIDKLYAFIQSPIDNPDTTDDSTSKASDLIRILELDISNASMPSVSGEFVYLLENDLYPTNVDKIGDAVWLEENSFALIQRDSNLGIDSTKLVVEIDLFNATNLQTDSFNLVPGKTLEQHTAQDLQIAGITPVSKKTLFNLPDIGYLAGDKPEGLALIPGDDPMFAVINDNDFGLLDEEIPGDGRQPFNPNPIPVVVGLVKPVPEPANITGLIVLGGFMLSITNRSKI